MCDEFRFFFSTDMGVLETVEPFIPRYPSYSLRLSSSSSAGCGLKDVDF